MRRFTPITFVVATLAGACGGGGPKYTITDQTLASISVQEKGGVLQAQQEQNVAKEEQNKANSDLKAAKNELDIVENEQKSAKLKLDSAKLSTTAANQSGDLNRKNQAIKDQRLAELNLKMYDAKVKWVEAKKKYYDALADAAEEHGHAAASKVELEKARLASQKGIKPTEDFNLANYENQNMEKQRKWDEARGKAEQKRMEVERYASQYSLIQQQWNSENGNPSTNPSQPYQQQNPSPTYAPQPTNQYQPQPSQPYQPTPYPQQGYPQNQPPPQQQPQNNPY